jgi:hypothetical protein
MNAEVCECVQVVSEWTRHESIHEPCGGLLGNCPRHNSSSAFYQVRCVASLVPNVGLELPISTGRIDLIISLTDAVLLDLKVTSMAPCAFDATLCISVICFRANFAWTHTTRLRHLLARRKCFLDVACLIKLQQ